MLSDEKHVLEVASFPTKISILGLKKSGKTTFLTVLKLSLVAQESRWQIYPHDYPDIERINTLVEVLFRDGFYPESTVAPEGIDEIVFDISSTTDFWGFNPGDKFELRTADVPGDLVKGIKGPFRQFYEEHVKNSAAVIFLIDPEQKCLSEEDVGKNGDYYYTMFDSIISELNRIAGKKMYAAFCITKADTLSSVSTLFKEKGEWDDDLSLEEIATAILGANTMRLINSFFDPKRLRWFAVSATGYYKDETRGLIPQSVMRMDATGFERVGIAEPRDLKPLGVAEVMEWVFDAVSKEHNRERGVNKILGRLKLT